MTGGNRICIILSVLPLDEQTDIKQVENKIRSITRDGLVWVDSKTEPIFGNLNRLKILAYIDETISIEDIEQEIESFDHLVQSVSCDSMTLI